MPKVKSWTTDQCLQCHWPEQRRTGPIFSLAVMLSVFWHEMSGWVGGPVELCWIGRVAIWSLVLCQSFVPYCFHVPISYLNLELSNFLPSDCFPTQRRDQEVINLCQFIHVLAVVLYLYIIPLYMVQFRALKSTVAISLKSVWPEFIDCELAVLALAGFHICCAETLPAEPATLLPEHYHSKKESFAWLSVPCALCLSTLLV